MLIYLMISLIFISVSFICLDRVNLFNTKIKTILRSSEMTESSDSFKQFDQRLSGSANDPVTHYPHRVDGRSGF